MPQDDSDIKADIAALKNALQVIGKILEWTIRKTDLVPLSVRTQAADGLFDVIQRITIAQDNLDQVKNVEDPKWVALEQVGLTGDYLKFKLAVGRELATPITAGPQDTEAAKASGGLFKRFFGWMNMLLGSLAKVPFLSALEAVKEFKEGVELVIEDQHTAPKCPGSILNLR
jgi:hypothetical protein